jgi:hypothetical protein
MGNAEDSRPGLSLTSRCLRRHGRAWIPVSGELHYSRVPRDRWADRLRLMRSGGISVVSTYVPWIHHVEHRDAPRFDGNLDIGAFVDLCRATGLEVVLRIGPWVHGETRNGGFPDWVQHAPVAHRTDDPAYLALVREWYGQLGTALAGRCDPGTVLAIQVENELYDQPEHLLTLKRLAREAGLSAPLWTATAWGTARLPAEEVLPVYGGYGDGFWIDAGAPWDASFRQHFFFSHVWDDPGIGADLRTTGTDPAATAPPGFPPATCELGGGMATAYHRRPRPDALDVAAVAHCKLGNGSAWQGYYMYAGGTNPSGDHGTQESHDTGYPNDMPRLGYDFHAPIGEAGLLAPSHAELRRQHAFLAAFGERLAEQPSSLPDVLPTGVDDVTTLRWAVRGGFLFIAWHQPHVPLPTYRDARFDVTLDDRRLLLPSRPVDIPPGTLARWPLGLELHGVTIDWATASVLTVLPGAVPTLVLCAEPGIPVEVAVSGSARTVTAGRSPSRLSGALDLLVLSTEDARISWVEGHRLLLSTEELGWGADGRVVVRTAVADPEVQVYDPERRGFRALPLRPDSPGAAAVPVRATLRRPAAGTVPDVYGRLGARQSAPRPAIFDELAAVYELDLPSHHDALLRIDWAGDVAELRIDGRPATDRFWDGSSWTVNLRDAGHRPGATATLHVLPLAAGSPVHLPAAAAERRAAASGQLLAVDAISVEGRGTWLEEVPSR